MAGEDIQFNPMVIEFPAKRDEKDNRVIYGSVNNTCNFNSYPRKITRSTPRRI